MSTKENIPYEVSNRHLHRAESPFHNSVVETRCTNGPALSSKSPTGSSWSNKLDVVNAKQSIEPAKTPLFPCLEHNHETLVSEHHVYEADQAPSSNLQSEGTTPPISNRHLDFGNDLFSNWYSSNEYSSVEVSDRISWKFQYDIDLLETHSYNMALLNSFDEKTLYQAQSGTFCPSILDIVTEYNVFDYQEVIPRVSQVDISKNNHTQNNSESSYYMDASEAKACNQEHRAFKPDNAYRDMETSGERVITPSKAILDYIPNFVSPGHKNHFVDSNAYACVTADTRTKNAKDDAFGPRRDIKDYCEELFSIDSLSTPKSNQVDYKDVTDSQMSTPSAYKISQLQHSLRINKKRHAQSYKMDSLSDTSPHSRRIPNFCPSRSSLEWRPVLFRGVNEIKKVFEAPEKRSENPEKNIPLQKHELDQFWKLSDKHKSYICVYQNCRRRFTRRNNVRYHIKTHMDYRPFRCKTCPKGYVRRYDLKRHTKQHTTSKILKTPSM